MKRCGNCNKWKTRHCKHQPGFSGLWRAAESMFCQAWEAAKPKPHRCGDCRWFDGRKCQHPAENLPTRLPGSIACCIFEHSNQNNNET